MKVTVVAGKKGVWNRLTTAVMALVLLSLFVPLYFSFGFLQSRAGYSSDFVTEDGGDNDLVRDIIEDMIKEGDTSMPNSSYAQLPIPEDNKEPSNSSARLYGNQGGLPPPSPPPPAQPSPSPSPPPPPPTPTPILRSPIDEKRLSKRLEDGVDAISDLLRTDSISETEKSCEEMFGSYCLWCKEHKEVMKDSIVKKLKDLLFVARAYYPSIAKKNHTHEKLTRELKQSIQDFERVLSEATTDLDLQGSVEKKVNMMEVAISKAKAVVIGCNNVDKKLAQIFEMTKDEALFHRRQSAFMYHLGVLTIPKSHHCLSMRLTVEYFRVHPDYHILPDIDLSASIELQHYVMFSTNVLASSVVINSTVTNSKESENIVFHVITDRQNYFAMKNWFTRNRYKAAKVHVHDIERYRLKHFNDADTDIPIPPNMVSSEEFRVAMSSSNLTSFVPKTTEYLPVFGFVHFYLPEIFPQLKKVVILDDDVVVMRDLSPLWSLDLEGKVIGAVEFCKIRFGHLRGYINIENSRSGNCVWMSGLNIVDLERWRELHLRERYNQWLQMKNEGEPSWRFGALSATLMTFDGLVHSLDSSWLLAGLGHNYRISMGDIQKAAVLHYNGNMKPWLDLGIPYYKRHWRKFLKKNDQYMDDCNVIR